MSYFGFWYCLTFSKRQGYIIAFLTDFLRRFSFHKSLITGLKSLILIKIFNYDLLNYVFIATLLFKTVCWGYQIHLIAWMMLVKMVIMIFSNSCGLFACWHYLVGVLALVPPQLRFKIAEKKYTNKIYFFAVNCFVSSCICDSDGGKMCCPCNIEVCLDVWILNRQIHVN